MEDTLIYGTFDFATIDNRKTRDRIVSSECDVLRLNKHKYANEPPKYIDSRVNLCWSKDKIQEIKCEQVAERVTSFITNMHFVDKDLEEYGKIEKNKF